MRKAFVFILFILMHWVSCAQNLVMNPSFENYTSCPTGGGQIFFAQGWSAFRGSPDYFNSCASTTTYVINPTAFFL